MKKTINSAYYGYRSNAISASSQDLDFNNRQQNMRSYRKKAWTCAITVTFILFFYTFSFAQTESIKGVQFKDGSIIYGRVIKMNVYDIHIETEDGKIISRKFEDVVNFIKDTGVDAKQESKTPMEEKVSQDKQVDKILPAVSSESLDVSGVKQKSSTFEMGFMYYNFDYKEDFPPPGKSEENGWLPGIYFDYTFRQKSIIYTRVHINYSAADIEYDGATQGGTPVRFPDQNTMLYKFEWDVGYPIPIGTDFTLIPYSGYGYRYWSRGQSRVTSTYIGYKEVYKRHYIPLGLKADYIINDRWNIGGSAAANFMFSGKMTAYLSESMAGLNDVDFTLGNKVGFSAEIPVTFRFTKDWALVLTPWYEYSAIGNSDNAAITLGNTVLGYAFEPDSKTHQYGINLGVNFNF